MDYRVTAVTARGQTHITVPEGTSLLEALRRGGIPIPAVCGGKGTCGKCQVIVENPGDFPPSAAERRLLPAGALETGLRLACTRKVERDLVCRVPMTLEGAVIATDSTTGEAEVLPEVRQDVVTVPPPGLEDQRSDETRLLSVMTGCTDIRLEALEALPGAVRGQEGLVTVVSGQGAVLDIRPGSHDDGPLGVAVDIGTTTLAAYLLELGTGRQLAVTSRLNPQKTYGDDVITRIDYARQSAEGLRTLGRLVADEIGGMTDELCERAGASPRRIFRVTVVGNTVMMHLFAGVSPEYIAVAPFTPAFTGFRRIPAGKLGWRLHPQAVVTVLPCIAGYVGADTVAVALATEILAKDRPCLILDIGTNGEIMLGDREGLTACSTAAGPAFEGAHIRFGMGGVSGAVSKVSMDGALRVRTIHDKPAMGICGSAIVDIVAGLLNMGAMDEMGLITPAGPAWLRERFTEEDRGWVFTVVSQAEGAGRDVVFCQRDVREVQLAKGAVAAGIATLLRERGVAESEVAAVYLAGGFGSFIDPAGACRIGLLPPSLLDRVTAIGNGAGAGARRALLSTAQMAACADIERNTRYIELSTRADFQELFVENMMFTGEP